MIILPDEKEAKIDHIKAILDERVALYKKRQIEIKRTLKTYHRANLDPTIHLISNLFEAIISYVVNLAASLSLDIMKNDKQFNDNLEKVFLCKNRSFRKSFRKNLEESKIGFQNLKLESSDIDIFCSIVFNLDENYQRTKINEFVSKKIDILIDNILLDITVFDDVFKSKIIKCFQTQSK